MANNGQRLGRGVRARGANPASPAYSDRSGSTARPSSSSRLGFEQTQSQFGILLMQAPERPASLARLLTADDAAQILNVSLRTVRRLIAQKKLPIVRLGRAVRIRPEALNALTVGE